VMSDARAQYKENGDETDPESSVRKIVPLLLDVLAIEAEAMEDEPREEAAAYLAPGEEPTWVEV
jgi:hypothetical protein